MSVTTLVRPEPLIRSIARHRLGTPRVRFIQLGSYSEVEVIFDNMTDARRFANIASGALEELPGGREAVLMPASHVDAVVAKLDQT